MKLKITTITADTLEGFGDALERAFSDGYIVLTPSSLDVANRLAVLFKQIPEVSDAPNPPGTVPVIKLPEDFVLPDTAVKLV